MDAVMASVCVCWRGLFGMGLLHVDCKDGGRGWGWEGGGWGAAESCACTVNRQSAKQVASEWPNTKCPVVLPQVILFDEGFCRISWVWRISWVRTNTHALMHARTYILLHTRMHAYTNYTHSLSHARKYTHAREHTHTHTHTHTHAHKYACARALHCLLTHCIVVV